MLQPHIFFIYNINNISTASSSYDKVLSNKVDERSILEKEKDAIIYPMGLEEVKSVLRVYHLGGNKYKADMYKKSVANLAGRFGEKLEPIIKSYGEETVIEGIRNFLQDPYWMDNGLPLPAFLKAPEKWLPGNASETRYNEPKRKNVPKYGNRQC